MANNRNFREVQEEYRESVVGLCCICQKRVNGFYGRWGNTGTCSSKCEREQEAKPRFLGDTNEVP